MNKRILKILSLVSVLLSLIAAILLTNGDEEFINTSNGSTGPGLSQFISIFIFTEVVLLVMIWGIPTLFDKKEK